MKKQIMASVLLASMMFAVPGYADYELTPDEHDSYYDKYKSPLEQSYGSGPIVNDRPKAKPADDDEIFARFAAQVTQRVVSNKGVSAQTTAVKDLIAVQEPVVAPANETEKGKEPEQVAVAAEKKVELEKADQRAEEVLSEQTTTLNLPRK